MKSYRRYQGRRRSSGLRRILSVLLILVIVGAVCLAAALGVILVGSRDKLQGQPQYLIILGCQVMPSGPSATLRDRLDEALIWLEEHPDMTVAVTGGRGADEQISEARAMADYLMARGIEEDRILLEERATSTEENLFYTMELLGLNGDEQVLIVSNGFHLARVRLLWGRVGGERDSLSTLAAPVSHVPTRIKMYLREPLALLKSLLLDWGV